MYNLPMNQLSRARFPENSHMKDGKPLSVLVTEMKDMPLLDPTRLGNLSVDPVMVLIDKPFAEFDKSAPLWHCVSTPLGSMLKKGPFKNAPEAISDNTKYIAIVFPFSSVSAAAKHFLLVNAYLYYIDRLNPTAIRGNPEYDKLITKRTVAMIGNDHGLNDLNEFLKTK